MFSGITKKIVAYLLLEFFDWLTTKVMTGQEKDETGFSTLFCAAAR